MMPKPVRILSAATLAVALTVAMGTTASGNNWSGNTGATSCGKLNVTDNNTHTYYNHSISSTYAAAIGSSATYIHQLPETTTTYAVSASTANTDVVFRDKNYVDYCGIFWWGAGGTVVGHSKCHSTNSTGRCNKHQIRLSKRWGDTQSYTMRKNRSCMS